ncbi:MAG: PqqD family protein [Anaerolineales bacterium]
MIQGKVPLRLPKARSDLEYFDQEIEGEEVVVVRDPVRGTYHKYNPLQAAMLRKLDGRRTLDELVASLSEEFEVEIPRQAAERFVAHARERLLLDVASFNVSDARAQKAVLKALKREGFEFRGTGSSADKELPARIVSGEAVLFMGGIRHLQAGQPARALDYFSAVLEINPNNTRAKTLVDCIQSAYVKALSGRARRRGVVDALGEDVLADSGLAEDERADARPRDALGERVEARHHGIAYDDLLRGRSTGRMTQTPDEGVRVAPLLRNPREVEYAAVEGSPAFRRGSLRKVGA